MCESQREFRQDEVMVIDQWNDRERIAVKSIYPKIGWRLRIAHEENKTLSIITDVIRFQDDSAIVKATAITDKGNFTGIGTASQVRDEGFSIHALLEIAETRAIARSLRFAGYGMEYCSAEEISHLKGQKEVPLSKEVDSESTNESRPALKLMENKSKDTPSPDPKEFDKITNKQRGYIIGLGKELRMDSTAIDKECVRIFGVPIENLFRTEATTFIDTLRATLFDLQKSQPLWS